MKQYTENQYDDDLTVGTGDYDDSYYTDQVDLFEFSTDDESPLARLKSLILSIDWEITDEVLRQFNEELVDLKDIWAGEKINLIYVQALEKISKYIYQFKADSHPNAIKLLLTFYYNLEKIVSSDDLDEQGKKQLLMDDIKKFEHLKHHITSQKAEHSASAPVELPKKVEKITGNVDDLLNLKAIVLGIDWEITDQDLNDLRQEVIRLEDKFVDSRPKLIFLQGIGTLGAYIKLKKSDAHADAFIVLHLFFKSFEKIVKTPMSLEEEKAVLFPAVEKFNAFKALLGATISPEAMRKSEKNDDESPEPVGTASDDIVPAFAEISEEESRGFQADREAKQLGYEGIDNVSSHINDFFSDPTETVQASEAGLIEESAGTKENADVSVGVGIVDKRTALQGVDVETEADDDSDENALPTEEGQLAPALPYNDEESLFSADELDNINIDPSVGDELSGKLDGFFGEENDGDTVTVAEDKADGSNNAFKDLDRQTALQGVDVETEADDDSDENALPTEEGQLAPALLDNDEESLFSAGELDNIDVDPSVGDELSGKLDGFFGEDESAVESPEVGVDTTEETTTEETVAEDVAGELSGDVGLSDDVEPADFDSDDELTRDVEDVEGLAGQEDDLEPALVGIEAETGKGSQEEEAGLEESFSAFFDDADLEKDGEDGSDVEALFDSFKEELPADTVEDDAVDTDIDDLFGLDEGIEEPADDALLFSLPADEMVSEKTAIDGVVSSVVEKTTDPETIGDSAVELTDDIPIDDGEKEVIFELVDEVEVEVEVESDSGQDKTCDEISSDRDGMEQKSTSSVEKVLDYSLEKVASDYPADQPSDVLQDCIHALELEIDDDIISGLLLEINGLQQKWVEYPQKKLYLQLLSIVAQHIDQYRYEASADAYGLLLSINGGFLGSEGDDSQSNEDVLAVETLKVLQWQQGMLDRQAIRKGDTLSFVDPLRGEGSGLQEKEDLSQSFADSLQSPEAFSDEERSPQTGADVTEDIKNEISHLRQTLQKEIAELRREIQNDFQS